MNDLRARLQLQRGRFALDVTLHVRAGETLVLVGPNGAGKTTCLHTIAGLVPLDGGALELGGRCVDGGPDGPFEPPERRCVGLLFQDHLLFPTMSVLDNVAFGPSCRGRSRREARARAMQWLGRVGMAELAHERPQRLSGGQAQRVALARALAAEPSVLLLDEPLSMVDAAAKAELRRELRRHLDAFAGPRLAVVHDVADAFALADRIAVLEAGRLSQQGRLQDLAARPGSRDVADLFGLNCFAGTCRDGTFVAGDAQLVVPSASAGDVLVTVHPRAVALFRERPAGSPRNVFEARIAALEPSLDRVRVRLDGSLPWVAEVTPAAVDELALAPGERVWVAVKATELTVTPR